MRYNQNGRLRKSDGIIKSSASLSARYEKPLNNNLELLREEILKNKKSYQDDNFRNKTGPSNRETYLKNRVELENHAFIPNVYRHPGKIKNSKLLNESKNIKSFENTFLAIKDDLVEHHDYEAVSSEIWKYLSAWFNYDVAIPRYIVYDPKTEKTYLQLYPQIQC